MAQAGRLDAKPDGQRRQDRVGCCEPRIAAGRGDQDKGCDMDGGERGKDQPQGPMTF